MRLIIAGSRHWVPDGNEILPALLKLRRGLGLPVAPWAAEIECVISGCAMGTDRAGERWANRHGIAVAQYPADWSRGRQAGHERNALMGAACTHAIIFRADGRSNGTDGMVAILRRLGRPFVLVTPWGTTIEGAACSST